MQNIKQMPGLIAGLLGLLLMTACGSSANATPTMDANAVYTQAAAVVQVALTNAAALTPSVTVTPISTNTPIPTGTVATQASLPMPVTLPSITAPAIADKAIWISNDPAGRYPAHSWTNIYTHLESPKYRHNHLEYKLYCPVLYRSKNEC